MKHVRTLTALYLMLCGLLGAGCDSRSLPEAPAPEPQPVEAEVKFSLPVQIMASARTAAGKQTPDEQAVSSLLAVAFNTDGATAPSTRTDGQNAPEDDTTPFYAAVPIDVSSMMNPISDDDDEGDFSFGLGKEGTFYVCFLANAKAKLSEKLMQMTPGAFTISQFKNYLADQDPGGADSDGGLLMTSRYFELTTSFTTPSYLGLVEMTRAMSRIDLQNGADGINVTRILFYNRSDRTRLFNDKQTTLDSNCLQTEPEEYNLADTPLEGSAQKPATLATPLYSYEQLASADDEELPYLDIRYVMPSISATREYSHKVYFDTADGTPIPLKRNTLYHVNMVNRDGQPVFSIEVADWEEGASVLITDADLIGGVKASH